MQEEDNSSECLEIENEIKELQQKINTTKDKIFKHYTKQRTSTNKIIKDVETNIKIVDEEKSSINLNDLFYNHFIQLKYTKDECLITLLFPFNGESRFGLNLRKIERNKWSLDISYLPHSVNLDDLKSELKELYLEQISEHLEKIQANVYAFCIRENQVNQLKEIMDPHILFYHCINYLEMEFKFKIFIKKTEIRKVLQLQLRYELLSIKPSKILCKINGTEDEDKKCEDFFNSHFKIFKTCDLVTAYNTAFRDIKKYKFFV